MRTFITGILLAAALASAWEYTVGSVKRLYISNDGHVYFGINTGDQPHVQNTTCTYVEEQFVFDGTTPAGKNQLATILSAKASNSNVELWYEISKTPGGTNGGCTSNTLSMVDMLGYR